MTLEEHIKYVAKQAARERWDLPIEGVDITIKRVEQVGENSWHAYYDEPDTGTEEDMLVERKGNMLEASYYEEVLAIGYLVDEGEEADMKDMEQIRREWQAYRNEGLGERG